MSTTNAVLFTRDPREASYGKMELPELGSDDVMIASKVVGICRSDIELLDGHLDAQLTPEYPVVPGHEWSGEVIEVGSNVDSLKAGDPVVGECVIAPNHWFGFNYNGAMADQFIAPSRLLHRMPSALTFEQGALIEPFTISYRAIRESGGCDASDLVVIVGGGMIGQCSLAVAKGMGARTVVVEPSEARRELAIRMGAECVLDPSAEEDIAAALLRETGQDGGDLVVECSGNPDGLASTLTLARFGGRVANIGICAHEAVSAPLGLIQSKDLAVRGTTGSPGVWPQALRFVDRNEIDLTPVITSRFAYSEASEALLASDDSGSQVKVHLTPEGA